MKPAIRLLGALLVSGCLSMLAMAVAEAQSQQLASTPTAPIASYRVMCAQSTSDLSRPVLDIARELEDQRIMYNDPAIPLSDCSGIFHQVLQLFDRVCPGHNLPPIERARDTGSLGRWYAANDLLTIVTDIKRQTHLIRPGAVIFYGRYNQTYPAEALQPIDNVIEKIEHVGIVVAIHRDSQGELQSYELFHGRSTGKRAAITNYHVREPRSASAWPFGNGKQQLIAIAPLVQPIEMPVHPTVAVKAVSPAPTPQMLPTQSVQILSWAGRVAPQSLTHFQTHVLTALAAQGDLKLHIRFEATPQHGVSTQQIEAIKNALRNLGLSDTVQTQ